MASTRAAQARQRYDSLVEAVLPLYPQRRYAEALARMDAPTGTGRPGPLGGIDRPDSRAR